MGRGPRRLATKKLDDRGRWLLKRLCRFATNFGWWPSLDELHAFTDRGSRRTLSRDLRTLADNGLAESGVREWRVTADGFEIAGMLPFAPRLGRRPKAQSFAERRRARNLRRLASFTVLEAPSLPTVD